MISKKQLKTIIDKINNRCSPFKYETFDELLDEVEKTSISGNASFFTEDEIKWVQSHPEIERNIMEMCRTVIKNTPTDDNATLYGILRRLNLSFNEDMRDKKEYYLIGKKNLQFLSTSDSHSVRGTMEEILLMLDLSLIPYR